MTHTVSVIREVKGDAEGIWVLELKWQQFAPSLTNYCSICEAIKLIYTLVSSSETLMISPLEHSCDDKGKIQTKFLGSVHKKQQVTKIFVFADFLLFGSGKEGFIFIFIFCLSYLCALSPEITSLFTASDLFYMFFSEPELNIWPWIWRPANKPMHTLFFFFGKISKFSAKFSNFAHDDFSSQLSHPTDSHQSDTLLSPLPPTEGFSREYSLAFDTNRILASYNKYCAFYCFSLWDVVIVL